MSLHGRVAETHEPSGSDAILHTMRPHIGWANGSAKTKADGSGTNFDKIVETATSHEGINVSLYKSRETGLKVLIADVETPIVRNALPLPGWKILTGSGEWILYACDGDLE